MLSRHFVPQLSVLGLWQQIEAASALESCPTAQAPDSQTNADFGIVERTYASNLSQLTKACGKLATRTVPSSCSGPRKPTLTLTRVQRITKACLAIQR